MNLVLPPIELAGVDVVAGPLVALPADARAWMEAQLAGARVRSSQGAATDAGWLVRLVRSDVVDGERVIESRLHALYWFGAHGAVAVACGNVDAPDLTALLLRGRPDFATAELVALADAWAGYEEMMS